MATTAEGPAKASAQTLDRGLRVLGMLARPQSAGGATVTTIAAELGVGRTIVYRLLSTLEEHGLVRRAEDGRWLLGMGVARLSGALLPRVRESASPVLRRLADEVGATAHLSLVEGDEVVAVLVVEPTWTDYHVAYRVGSRHELDQGAAGKAVLAARGGRRAALATSGELQSGAHGVACALAQEAGIEGSVGVVALHVLDRDVVGPLVAQAADDVSVALG